MAFRTLVIKNRAKIETRLGYLLVRGEEEKWYHIREIDVLIIESTACAITTQAILELAKSKVNIIFCDEKHLPYSTLSYLNANVNTSGNIKIQCNWNQERKAILWQRIVYQKIYWQMRILEKYKLHKPAEKLKKYLSEVQLNDISNREGHAAKVYFNALFGQGFSRQDGDFINSSLNYTYAILMSEIARDITAYGYINAIGIWHNNQFNSLNLACDFMEIFRPIVDDYVIRNCKKTNSKMEASNIFSIKIKMQGKYFYFNSACDLFVRNYFRFLKYETDEILKLESYEV